MQQQEQTTGSVLHRQTLLGEALESRTRRRQSDSRLRIDAATLIANAGASDEQVASPPARFGEASAAELDTHLRTLATQADLSHAQFLEAIVRFDEIGGLPETTGHRCALSGPEVACTG